MRLAVFVLLLASMAARAQTPAPASARALLRAAAEAGAVADPAARAAAVEALWRSLRPGQDASRVPFVSADTAIFLYRGPAASAAVAGDHTGWNPSAALRRQGASDLWLRTERVDPAARLDYKLVLGGSTWILDPANPHRQASGFGPNSELRMPEWQMEPLTVRDPSVPRGTLSNPRTITSQIYTTAPVSYRVWTPAGYETGTARLPSLYVTDGHEYADDALGALLVVLDNLVAQRRIEPLVVVLIDPRQGGTNRRQEQLVTNASYARFVAEDLVPRIDAAYRTQDVPEARGILGTSLGGLFSAYLGARHPDVFTRLAIHSPAFWVADPAIYTLMGQTGTGAFRVAMTTGTVNDGADNARRMRDVLEARGHDVTYREVPEGHSWGNWRALIDDVLVPLFPPRPVAGESAAEAGALRLDAVPNPGRAVALRYTLAEPGPVRLTCADAAGRTVAAVDTTRAAGVHEHALAGVAAGVYVCRLAAGGALAVRTVTVLR